MCHVVLLLPVLALPVFWILPLPTATAVYLVALLGATAIYWSAFQSARKPRLNGAEAMLGARGRVVKCGEGGVTVLFHGELWSAETAGEALAVGDEAVVERIDGLRLRVTSATSETRGASLHRRAAAAARAPRASA